MDAYKTEMVLRAEHELSVDKLIGEVRALFPRDRATQDAIFPETTGRAASVVEEPEVEEPEQPGGSGADPTSTP